MSKNVNQARRQLLVQTTSAWALSVAGGTWLRSEEKAAAKSVPNFIPGKDSRLIGHNLIVGEIETPLALLREHRLTPKQLLFVRNNQVLPGSLSVQPAPLDGWRMEFAGMVDRPASLTAAEIVKLPSQEQEVVLQCSGNGRSFFARARRTDGVQWRNGAMGNVRLRGVPLATVLAHLKITVNPAAQFVAVEGADRPEQAGAADFEHSVPWRDASEKALLVWEMNGEPLPQVHGGPLRFIMPGYYATMNVKWVQRLRFESGESLNHHHVGRYRTPRVPLAPGSSFVSTLENSDANWNMRLKSVIFAPLEGESLRAGMTSVRGVAWNDGVTRIDAVEVSADGGQTWRRAKLERPSGPYAWHHWDAQVPLAAGKHVLRCRAIDALGMSQPLDGTIHWNPAGYAWSGVDQVEVSVA